MGSIAEIWVIDEDVQLYVQRMRGVHRALGVLLVGDPPQGSALLFTRCRSLHGMWMKRPLDAVFLDADGYVLRVSQLQPSRVAGCRGAAQAIELAAGEAQRLGIAEGTQLKKLFVIGGYGGLRQLLNQI